MNKNNHDLAAIAKAHFAEGFSCSQSLMLTFASRLGIDRDLALKLGASFGGGMARMGWTCGAVTGALMVIGTRYGNVDAKDDDKKEDTYRRVQEFLRLFKEKHGTVNCRDLLGCDLSTPEELERANSEELCQKTCPKYVSGAAELVEKIIDQ